MDLGETCDLVASLEVIHLLLGLACIHKIKLFQMDVKSAFLNKYLSEKVFVAQRKGIIDPAHPQHVYKLHKGLYGLKQAPRAWYDKLTDGFIEQMQSEFEMSLVKELAFCLGFQVRKCSNGIFQSQ